MEDNTELVCYNRGCGQRFKEQDNVEDSCQFHAGAPIFHEGYKGWSCCKKKTIDFTEFLNIPGCTIGLHNKEKLAIPAKQKEAPLPVGEVIKHEQKIVRPPLPASDGERPSDDLPKSRLKSSVSSSLTSMLQRHRERQKEQLNKLDATDGDAIVAGAPCKNNACSMTYVDENSNKDLCEYHSGGPVFHEGYKYWSCCKKRTSDFAEFLKQSGCKKGDHNWQKASEAAQKASACRYDWHQTGSYVCISIYAKTCNPEQTYVEANQTSLQAHLAFNDGANLFDLSLNLFGLIDPDQSQIELMGTKLEIKLKKKNLFGWKKLEFVPAPVNGVAS